MCVEEDLDRFDSLIVVLKAMSLYPGRGRTRVIAGFVVVVMSEDPWYYDRTLRYGVKEGALVGYFLA